MLEIEKMIRQKNVCYRLIPLKQKAVSASEVKKNAKVFVPNREVCKTILLKTKAGSLFALFLEGNKKIDFKKVKQKLKQKIFVLTPEEVKKYAGVLPGAVCPLLLNMPVFADKKVLKLKKINFGSGDLMHGIELNTKDFFKLKKPGLFSFSK